MTARRRGLDDGLGLGSCAEIDGSCGERPELKRLEEARLDERVVGMPEEPSERLRLGDLGFGRQRDGVAGRPRRTGVA